MKPPLPKMTHARNAGAVRRGLVLTLSILGILLAGLVASLLLLPIWIGEIRLEQTMKQLAARGEKLNLTDFRRAPVPVAENYFSMPYFREASQSGSKSRSAWMQLHKALNDASNRQSLLFGGGEEWKLGLRVDFRKYVILKKGETISDDVARSDFISRIRKTIDPFESIRDDAVTYRKYPCANSDVKLDLASLNRCCVGQASLALGRLLRLHGILALHEGRREVAFEDTLASLRTAEAVCREPGIVNLVAANSVWGNGMSVIHEGIQLWTEDQLHAFERVLEKVPMTLDVFANQLRVERARTNRDLQPDRRKEAEIMPYYQPERFLVTCYADWPLANYNLAMQQLIVLAESPSTLPSQYEQLKADCQQGGLRRFTHFFDDYLIATMIYLPEAIARSRNETELTRVAIALELFQRNCGEYPAQLSELEPQYIPQIPEPWPARQEIQYRLSAPDQFCLWTWGWDGVDQGGIVRKGRSSDWVLSTREQ